MNHKEDFARFRYVLIDECHQVNSLGGQYKEFLESEEMCVIGLTATPYRLGRGGNGFPMLKFLTRTRPRIFQCLLYYCQISELLAQGYLARLTYYDLTDRTPFDISRVRTNSTGAEFDENSMRMELERSGFRDELFRWTQRVLTPKKGSPRKGVLVFTQFVKESVCLVKELQSVGISAAVVSADTPKREREQVIDGFRSGRIRVVANAATLTTGFDYPELDTVIMARATMSLSLWYQIVGRAIRPCEGKNGWIVDLCGNIRRFGHVEDLRIECPEQGTGKWCVMSKGRQLTNVPLFR
jgi:DNA repair protein RadD